MDAGETAVLICVGFGQPRADITWTRDGQEISNRSLVTIYEEDLAQGGRVFKQSFLQLCSLRMSDSGVYTCSVSNGLSSVNSSVELSVSGRLIFWIVFCVKLHHSAIAYLREIFHLAFRKRKFDF